MIDSSFLACIRIRASAPGENAFLSALQNMLCALSDRLESFSYAELLLNAGDHETALYWLGDERPDISGAAASLPALGTLDLRLNLCSDEDCFTDALDGLTAQLADGAQADRVRLCALLRRGDDASLFLSGLQNSAFHHGVVPFRDGLDGAAEDMCWNSLTHFARFTFPESVRDDAWNLSDLLQERIDEIDLEFSYDDGTLGIHSVQLTNAEDAEFYRAALEQLLSLSDSASLGGVLAPEAENAFALLRYCMSDGRVTVQSAVAEI